MDTVNGPADANQVLQGFAHVLGQMMKSLTQQNRVLAAALEELRQAQAARQVAAADVPREAKVEGLAMPSYHGRPDESVEEFFFRARLFMEGKNIDYTAVANQTRLVAMLASNLKDGAASWYHHRVIVDNNPVHTLLEFQAALEREFVPPDQQQRLRPALKQCRQTGGIEDYVARFRRLISQVREMSQLDMIDRFIDGLKKDTQQEVNYLRCATLTAAIAAAQAYERTHFARSAPPVNRSPDPTPMDVSAVDSRNISREQCLRERLCFYCKRPGHQLRDCRQRQQQGNESAQ